jgi:integral membrane protein
MTAALKFFRISSYVTGIFLLLLCLEMVVRYGFGYDLILGGVNGFLVLEARGIDGAGLSGTGINMSTAVLIIHGWLYVVYLFAGFRMWSLYRWSFLRFVIIASGGVVPALSFFTENYYTKVARAQLAKAEASAQAKGTNV